MRIRPIAFVAMMAVLMAWPSLVSGQAASKDLETITPSFKNAIPNLPGKSLVGLVVSYPPGGLSRAHYHPHSSFVTGFVLSGAIRSKVGDGEEKVFRTGESWSEPPGAYHPVSANASTTEPASLLAVFVVDTADAERLVTYERK